MFPKGAKDFTTDKIEYHQYAALLKVDLFNMCPRNLYSS